MGVEPNAICHTAQSEVSLLTHFEILDFSPSAYSFLSRLLQHVFINSLYLQNIMEIFEQIDRK